MFALLDEETATLEGWLLAAELLIIIGVLEVLPVGPPSSVVPPPQPVSRMASKIDDVEENKCLDMMTP